jgi:hypothetical protein
MNRSIIYAIAGGICVVIVIFLLIDYIEIRQRGEELKLLDEKIRASGQFNAFSWLYHPFVAMSLVVLIF